MMSNLLWVQLVLVAIAVAVIAAERARRGRNKILAGEGLLLGELSLFGEVRPVRGLLAIVLAAARMGENAPSFI